LLLLVILTAQIENKKEDVDMLNSIKFKWCYKL